MLEDLKVCRPFDAIIKAVDVHVITLKDCRGGVSGREKIKVTDMG